MRDPRRPNLSRRSESGSAYIAALLALVVLSILGLSVALTSQTEMLIGSNERLVTRVLYAADSGVGNAIAGMIPYNAYRQQTLTIQDPVGGNASSVENTVEVSRVIPIQTSPCNLCQQNQDRAYYKINHTVTATARRGQVASKTVTSMFELQPREEQIPPMNVLDHSGTLGMP